MVEGNLISDIRKNFETKSSLELLKIWVKNDHDQLSEEAFQAARELLLERGVTLPPQNESSNTNSEEESLSVILSKKRFYLIFQLSLIAAHLFIGFKFFLLGRDWAEYSIDIFTIGSYLIVLVMFGIVIGLIQRSRYTMYLAIFAIIITFPITLVFLAAFIFFPASMALFILGIGGLFIALEIGTIYFVYAVAKREKYWRGT